LLVGWKFVKIIFLENIIFKVSLINGKEVLTSEKKRDRAFGCIPFSHASSRTWEPLSESLR
jgi:hypothetical protein